MSAAPELTVLPGGWNRSGDPGAVEAGALDSWNRESVAAVEIVTPDRYCAALLLDHAASVFPAELVPGPGWVVRFRPPADGRDWVVELLALVERWLQSAPLPCAKGAARRVQLPGARPGSSCRTALSSDDAAPALRAHPALQRPRSPRRGDGSLHGPRGGGR